MHINPPCKSKCKSWFTFTLLAVWICFFTFILGKCKKKSVTLTQHHVNAFGRVSVYTLYTCNDHTYYQPILINCGYIQMCVPPKAQCSFGN